MIFTHILHYGGKTHKVRIIDAPSLEDAEEAAAIYQEHNGFDADDPRWQLVEGEWFLNEDWKPSTAMPPNLPGSTGPKPRRS
jgi:hypothetical protein